MVVRHETGAERLKQAIAFHRRGDFVNAEKNYAELIACDGRHYEALRLLGVLKFQTRREADGIALIEQSLRIKPDNVAALDNLGVALKGANRHDDAVKAFDKALQFNPDHLESQNNRAITLFEGKKFEQALAGYDKVLSLKSDHLGALNDRNCVLRELGRHDEALASLDRALSFFPNEPKTLNNRGVTLKEMGRLDEAMECFGRALAMAPHYADLLHNRGNVFLEVGDPTAALADYDRALALEPNNVEFMFSKSVCLLLLGDFPRGFSLYESRKERQEFRCFFAARNYPQPLWLRRQPLNGKTIFLYWEQGFGDTLQFCRFARTLEGQGATVVLSVQKRLKRLLHALGPSVTLIEEREAPAAFDYHLPLMSLPLALGLDAVPHHDPYLAAEPERVAYWREKIGGRGFRIGVNWHGNAAHKKGLGRSFPLKQLARIAEIPDVRLISLQKFDGLEQLQNIRGDFEVETLGEGFDEGEGAFVDAAAAMKTLDLVITCDTAVAHLAGALGVRTWVALKFSPEWRWSLERADTPWYPTLKLFRQPFHNDWNGVFAEMEQVLRAEVGAT